MDINIERIGPVAFDPTINEEDKKVLWNKEEPLQQQKEGISEDGKLVMQFF